MLISFRILAAIFLPAVTLAASAPNPEGAAFFEKNIQPILEDHCFKCHSHSSEKIKGGLVLDSREAALTGGDTGPAIVPGDSAKSLLIEAVAYANEDLQMPPKGKKLTGGQIALLTEWVKRGAPWKAGTGQKMATRPKGKITDEERRWWSFQPVAKVEPPQVADGGWSANEIDRFVFKTLAANGLKPAPLANPEQLIRRLSFDLTGLPPTTAEVEAFHESYTTYGSNESCARLIDRLLASPQYGEHWARHWLDLARYAESDGFRIDDSRPHAWRYRDYVIQAFNDDKPYDRFVQEQLAGDEIFPGNPQALVATGFLRHGIYEYNNRDVAGQWAGMLNDVTDVAGDVFLGLGMQCARCHDHKFDPILQKDYYRLQAFFAPLLLPYEVKVGSVQEQADYRAELKAWEEKTADLRAQIAAIEEPAREKAAMELIGKFPPETQEIVLKPMDERTPWENQIADLAFRQVLYEWDRLINRMRGAGKDKIVGLQKQLAAFDKDRPVPLPTVLSARDVGRKAPPVFIPKKQNLGEIEPGFPTVLDEKPAVIQTTLPESTGRRAALARWLTAPENPLTARVIVNRVWQYHFGRGLVGTSSDFGKLGDKPSHPELLDWLTQRFVADGWSFKKLHRLILTSATYRQSANHPALSVLANPQSAIRNPQSIDPENLLLWRASTRRLDAEQIRDAILSTTGELKLDAGGPGVDVSTPRRTVYTKVLRNTRDALLDVFDTPEGFTSTPRRDATTTPTQSLMMINSPWSLARAGAFANRLKRESSEDDGRRIDDAYRIALGRTPSAAERNGALKFMAQHAQLVPPPKDDQQTAPFISEKMPFRDGRAAVLTPGTPMDRLTIPDHPAFPGGDFTIEGFIVMKSLYDDGQMRTIASHWDGDRLHRGWSFAVTGKQSSYKPQTLVLLLRGEQVWTGMNPVEPIFSGLQIEVGKPYFVAASVKLGDMSEQGITFYAKDLSNDDEPVQVATIPHKTTSGIRSKAAMQIGARGEGGKNLFDGIIDDVRLSDAALPAEQLLLDTGAVGEHTVAYWKFENDPGAFKGSVPNGADIVPRVIDARRTDPRTAALIDFCHVLLNSNEFLYLD